MGSELLWLFWIGLMAVLVTSATSLIGTILLVRRSALMGDTLSHSILPGLVLAFLATGSRSVIPMMIGALLAGLAAVWLVETISSLSRIKSDAAMGIVFTSLFALGVALVSQFSDRVDIDADCVLYGEIGYVPLADSWNGVPVPVVRMAAILSLLAVVLAIFKKEILAASFDPRWTTVAGLRPRRVHYGIMALASGVIVTAFESVGAILVVAMLILPGATAVLVARRLPWVQAVALGQALVSSTGGILLAQGTGGAIAPSVVVVSFLIFLAVWIGTRRSIQSSF